MTERGRGDDGEGAGIPWRAGRFLIYRGAGGVIPAQPIRLDSRLRGNDGEGPWEWRRGGGGGAAGWWIGGGNLAVWLRRRPGADVQVAADGGQGGVHLIQARVMSDVQHAVDLG